MRIRLLVAVLIVVTFPLCAESQSSLSVPIQFPSADSIVHGQFFRCRGDNPVGTLVLVPGWPGNPQDVLGLGALLAERNINVLVFNPRGMHSSEGIFTFAHTLEDIGAALAWLEQPVIQERFRIDIAQIALGGHSFGGAVAMAYTAADPEVLRVISIAGNDLGWLIRKMQADSQYSEAMRQMLRSTRAPDGPVRFDLEAGLRELAEHQDIFGLKENSSILADRAILLVGGWDDMQVPMEDVLLPLYRSLKGAQADDVTILAYEDDHAFQGVIEELATDIEAWLVHQMGK